MAMVSPTTLWGDAKEKNALSLCTNTPSRGALPAGVLRFFSSNTGSRVAHVHTLVFGASNSFMMTWRGKDGSNYQCKATRAVLPHRNWCTSCLLSRILMKRNFRLADSMGLPPDLEAWIEQKDARGYMTRNIANLRLALGPNNASFFVTDGKDYFWRNLPAAFNQALEARRKKGGGFTSAPRIVALGIGGNYVMIDSGNGGSWILSKYPALEKEFSDLIAANHNRPGALRSIAVRTLSRARLRFESFLSQRANPSPSTCPLMPLTGSTTLLRLMMATTWAKHLTESRMPLCLFSVLCQSPRLQRHRPHGERARAASAPF